MSRIFRVNERAFLNLHTNLRAYIIAYVEDSEPYPACCEQYRNGGWTTLRIADCYNEIDLYFDLSTPKERDNAVHKARVLAETLSKFRDAIENEVAAIEARSATPPHARAMAAVH